MKSIKGADREVEILIAEDSATQREQLQHLLEEHDYAVVAAANGKEALAAARHRRPTLIVSDIIMPELDGYGLCKAVKSDDTLRDVPVILLTTLADPRDILKGLECGADNFIRKPYEEKYLLSRIDYMLMNLDLRKNQKMQMGVKLTLGNQTHFITTERQQVLDMLISTYEQAVAINGELKVREKDLAHSNQVLNGLYRIAEGLNGAVSVKEVTEMALARALELPGIQAGWVFLREGESGFRMAVARNLPPALECAGAMEGDCMCRRQLVSGALDHVTNILECERLGRADGDTRGLRYHASVPLWNGTRAVGLMNLLGPEKGLFDEAELKVLYSVGNQVAMALERAYLHENLEHLVQERTARVARLNRIYSVLSGINTLIVRVRDRQELFTEACRIAVDLGGFGIAWIGTLHPETLDIIPAACAGVDAESLIARSQNTARADSPMGLGVVGRTIREKRAVFSNNLITETSVGGERRKEAIRRGYRSVVALPLLVDGAAVGSFSLFAKDADFFNADELKLLNELAGDISFALDHIAKEEKLNYLAYYDALTGLPNRALLDDRMAQRLRAASHEQSMAALVLIDLERFRAINDTLGRHVADDMLKFVAQRLQSVIFDRDSLARVHADVFAALFSGIKDEADIAHIVEEKIIGCLNQPFTLGGQELRVSAKIGVALFPSDAMEPDALYSAAETALNQAKGSSDRYLFYARKMNAQVAERLKLENKLQRALERDEFVLFYQPKVDLSTGRAAGLEALIRWNDPDDGLVPPMKFIPLLEETGMIVEVGAWAMKQAVLQYAVWQAAGLRPPRVAVNVSQVQLKRKDFVTSVQQAIAIAGKSDHGLDIEITESMIMDDVESCIEKLKLVRGLGAGVAIDDFGTGYSSLRYLARLPVTALKIDRAFVRDVTTNPDNRAIVATVISLAHNMKLTVVAEGVETGEQRDLLQRLKCDEMQGYLFSKPVPAEQVPALLASGGKSGGAS